MNRHIAILVHENDQFEDMQYLLQLLAGIWRKSGVRVSVLSDPMSTIKADLAILHVNLTVVPENYIAWANQHHRVLNGRVADITKRAISSNLVCPGDNYCGPVIVKTNWNSGGSREALLARQGPLLRRFSIALRNSLPWSFRSRLTASNYHVFESVTKVPRSVWYNPDFIVERFLPEYHDGYYCLRSWIFLGDKERAAISYSKDPVIKSYNTDHFERLDNVPDELRLMRQALGFDFGKFDYVINDGQVVLYDANRTPTTGIFSMEQCQQLIETLSEGIQSYWD